MTGPAKVKPPSRDPIWLAPAICLALVALCFCVFGQAVRFEFINYDDGEYVYENPMVSGGLTAKGIVWAFTHSHSGNWHPLTWISLMLDCQLFGPRAGGMHLTNLLLHSLTAAGLFLVLRRWTGRAWRCAFVAAVFAVHPLRAESVAWVSERKDVLSGFFFVLTMAAYGWYARRPSAGRYATVVVAFVFGLLSKPMLVTLPLLLILFDYWPLSRKEPLKKLVWEKLPLLGISAAACVATVLAQSRGIQDTRYFSLPLRLENALMATVIYMRQMFWPHGLAAFYPYPHQGLPVGELVVGGIIVAGITAIALARRRTWPWLWMGWAWYLLMLLPVLGIIQVGFQSHADRYTYLPQIGLYIAITWLASEAAVGRTTRTVAAIAAVAIVLVLTLQARAQASYWRDSIALWRHTIDCTEGNDLTHKNLAQALFVNGDVKGAIAELDETLKINPSYGMAHYDLGIALEGIGDMANAIAEFKSAVQINPNFGDAHLSLATAMLRAGQPDEAIAEYEGGLRLKPDNVDAQANLANLLAQQGNAREALPHFEKALELSPENPMVENNLAWLLATAGDNSVRNGDRALHLAQHASVATGQTNALVERTVAAALAEGRHFPEAVAAAQRALQLAESQGNIHLTEQLKSHIAAYQAGRPLHP